METESVQETETKPPKPSGPAIFAGAMQNKRFVIKFIVFSVAFWLAQYAYQLYILNAEFAFAVVRSLGFAGATFITLALLSSVIFKQKPQYAKYWYVRRSLGVMGFVFISFHVFSAINLLGGGNVAAFFPSLNPLENPIVFGAMAYPIFFVMALTSTDWAMAKLGGRRWKAIHRLVYFAYWASVFHFLTINPSALMNLAGYLLLTLTALTVAGELYYFVKMIRKGQSSPLGTAVGVIIILLWLAAIYLVYLS